MYEEFYNLLSKPFSLSPDSKCFFMSPQHSQALATFQYSLLSNAGLTLITGESGVGKTSLIRRVMSNLDGTVRTALISNTHVDLGRILPWVLSAFEVPADYSDDLSCYSSLKEFLAQQAEASRRAVLIVDEAQNLSLEALEGLRVLNNLNVDENSGLQLVLVGRPELADKLSQKSQRHLAQRIAIDYAIDPFDFEIADEYISFRLNLSGGKSEIFDYVSRASIFYHSHGIPRLINSICDLAMVYGFGESLETVDLRLVKKVLQSKKVSLNHFNRLERSRSAKELHATILASHGVDIARFGVAHGAA